MPVRSLKISANDADKIVKHLRDHETWVNSLPEYRKYGKNTKPFLDLSSFISYVESLSVPYASASHTRMYLEFRKRHLISLADHTESVISAIKEIDCLFDLLETPSIEQMK